MDTCLAAVVLGVALSDKIEIAGTGAFAADLENPMVCCIEAGGSGQVEQNNFDHHDPKRNDPPACLQAYAQQNCFDANKGRLVQYVSMVDLAQPIEPPIEFPSLSNLFSGMMLVHQAPLDRFWAGVDILQTVLDEKIDPFQPMPQKHAWNAYLSAKVKNQQQLARDLTRSAAYVSPGGVKVGFIQTRAFGGSNALYNMGCAVVIQYNPAFGQPPVAKFTVSSNGPSLAHLIDEFQKLEPGWGGRSAIIGSPFQGSKLSREQMLAVVLKNL